MEASNEQRYFEEKDDVLKHLNELCSIEENNEVKGCEIVEHLSKTVSLLRVLMQNKSKALLVWKIPRAASVVRSSFQRYY